MAAVLSSAHRQKAKGDDGATDPTCLGSVLSHRSAAALWGIRGYDVATVHITVSAKSRSSGSIRRHSGRLSADETTIVDGIPVTTVPRTILDTAATSSRGEVERMLREAEYHQLYDRISLRDLLDRYPGRRGSRAVCAALERGAESPGRVETPFEQRFLPFLDRHALPRPHFNAWLQAGGRRYRVDCLWPARRLIVELDGWEGHGTRAAFRADRERDRRLRVAGYSVARIAWSQLDDEAEAIAADLRALLAR
ncbi:MAG: DUF559 domain-containing protein [Solirubrobacterales bacterium]